MSCPNSNFAILWVDFRITGNKCKVYQDNVPRARSRSPPQKSMSNIKLNDKVFILTDGVNARFVVLLSSPNYTTSYKI